MNVPLGGMFSISARDFETNGRRETDADDDDDDDSDVDLRAADTAAAGGGGDRALSSAPVTPRGERTRVCLRCLTCC